MSEKVRYDESNGVIVIEAPVHVSHRVLNEFRARVEALPRFTPETPLLVDWTAVDQREVTPELVRDRARTPWPVTSRIAFYAPSDVLFGLARMYALQSNQAIETFRDREQALAWATARDGD